MIRIGVLGAGHLGKIHLNLIKEIEGLELAGFHDTDRNLSKKVAEEMGIHSYPSAEDLLSDVDAVDIVTPTLSHYDLAVRAVKKGLHVFIEKPVTNTPEQARKLMSLVDEAQVKGQVGHVERFNPAFLAVADKSLSPMFIEAHRLAQFNPRGTDVPVILDLMVHDIDIVLSLVKANVQKISASGVAVVSQTPDIANARIEFDNGCVANLTASRISMKQMRKMRLFQRDAYISVDFYAKKTQIFQLQDTDLTEDPFLLEIGSGENITRKLVSMEEPVVAPNNAIKMELELFLQSIEQDTEPPVTIMDGFRAIDIAHQVYEKVQSRAIL